VERVGRACSWCNIRHSTQSPWAFAMPSLIVDVVAVGGVSPDIKPIERRERGSRGVFGMREPTITCPNCKSQTKLTESLAAPLIQAVRAQCEEGIAHRESDVAEREATILRQQSELAKGKAGIEQRVADVKADLLRRRCELDDAQREMNLTIETKVQESLAALRQKARQDANDALKAEIIERDGLIASLKLQLAEKDELIASLKQWVAEKDEQIGSMNLQVEAERQQIAAEEAEKARLLVAANLDRKTKEVADLQEVLQERDKKLAEAQSAQAELIRKQRELDDAKREVELEVEKRVQQSLGGVRHKAKQEAEDAFKLKLGEKDQLIASLQRHLEEAKRKSEQGSQQLQGIVGTALKEIDVLQSRLLESKTDGEQTETKTEEEVIESGSLERSIAKKEGNGVSSVS
jgi:hypothetical protein